MKSITTAFPLRSARSVWVLAAASIMSGAPFVALGQVSVSTTQQLIDAVNNSPAGTTITVAPGTYALPATLRLKSGTSLVGSGMGQTIIRNAPTFALPVVPWYDADTNFEFSNPNAYLIDLGRDRSNFIIRDLTLTGPEVYGGLHFVATANLTVQNVQFTGFRWSGIRGFVGTDMAITGCRFLDAGGQTVNADGSFGITGGSLYIAYLSSSLIDGNRFERSGARSDNVFGVKGREFRSVRITNNTILCDFAIELPFENDYYTDIENNYLDGVVSLPRYAGGDLPPTGPSPYTFRIRNNYLTKSYSIEGPHNGMIVERNVFDFPVDSDYGNLFSSFDPFSQTPLAPGPLDFNNNIVINPGRGVFWSDVVWNNLSFSNNHIVANEIVPSQDPEGLFAFRESSPALGGQSTVFSGITIASNVVQIVGQSRPLIRSASGYGANISNNLLVNVSDSSAMSNPQTSAVRGLEEPLVFNVGVNGEFPVNGYALIARAAPGVCPAVQVQPAGGLVCRSGTRSVSVTLVPGNFGPVSYRWVRTTPGVSMPQPIGNGSLPGGATASGATTGTLTITGFSASDLGDYSCVISGVCGQLFSSPATLVSCDADIDCSGARDVADIFTFLSAWFANAPGSDFNDSGVRDVADIFAFLSAWFAGC